MKNNKDDVVKAMDGLELSFTKLCKSYSDTGEKLKDFSVVISAQVDTVELGLLIREYSGDWDNDSGMELYEYIAEKLKEKHIVLELPEVTFPQACDCTQHPDKN